MQRKNRMVNLLNRIMFAQVKCIEFRFDKLNMFKQTFLFSQANMCFSFSFLTLPYI